MKLEINRELYSYTFSSDVYIFDPYSFAIYKKDSDESKSIDTPIIFPTVARIEAQKAYVNSLNNKKLYNKFKNLNDGEYSNRFWHYFDDGWQKLIDYERFEDYYRIKRIVDWCDENYIPYFINQKDEFIKRVLDYKNPLS